MPRLQRGSNFVMKPSAGVVERGVVERYMSASADMRQLIAPCGNPQGSISPRCIAYDAIGSSGMVRLTAHILKPSRAKQRERDRDEERSWTRVHEAQ